jgi:CRP/FNR family cyclic AMP-dependent transcriptional regulator
MVAMTAETATGNGLLRPVAEGLEMICAAFADRGFVRQYPRNAFVFLEGAPATAAYAVKSGSVELVSVSDSGREVGHSVRGPGEVFGITELILRQDRTRGIRALEDTELWILPRDDFYALISERPEITLALLASALNRGVEQAELRRNLTGTSARHRVVSALDYLASRSTCTGSAGGPITVRVTHERLSGLCGLTRQTVTSELDRLEAEGLLELKSRFILVLDRRALQQAVEAKR